MRKLRLHNKLRGFPVPPTARPAFSLAELVISMAILVLLMSLAGQVFNFTVESTGQATALTRINQTIRMMERTIRADLAQVQAGHAIMIIQGNPVNAYWTADGRESDDNSDPSDGYGAIADPDREDVRKDLNGNPIPLSPRADVLMFVTARRGKSYVNPEVTSQLQLITYGMAELGDYTYDPTTSTPGVPDYKFDFQFGTDSAGVPNSPVIPVDNKSYPDPTIPSQFPASQWHLFRRPTLLLSSPFAALVTNPALANNLMPPPLGGITTLRQRDFEKLINGEKDIMAGVSLEEDVLRPDIIPFITNDAPNMAPWYLPSFLVGSFPRQAISRSRDLLPLFAQSKLDPLPPPQLATRMGHYFLPHCAYFKVEWTLDPQSEFVGGRLDGINDILWFDPGDDGDPLTPNAGPDPLRSAAFMLDRLQVQIDELNKDKGKQAFLRERHANLLSLIEEPWDDGSLQQFCAQVGYSLQDRFRGASASHTVPSTDPTCGWPHPFDPGIIRPNMHVFTATRPKLHTDPVTLETLWNGEDLVPDPMFPGALRITIDLYDREGRLERPIRHVMIIPLGG